MGRQAFRIAMVGILLIGLLAIIPQAVLGQGAEQRQRMQRGELVIGYQSDAQNLDPRRSRITPDRRVNGLIHSALLRATSKGLVGDLATSWEIRNPTTYIFKLRNNVKFHDGSPVTSADVKFTYDTMRDPQFASPDLGTFSVINAVEAPDATTVVFRLKEPRASFISELWRGIVSKRQAEADPQAANLKPIGSGPYRFVEWVPNTRIVLEGFRDYFEGAPGFSKITFVPITDNAVRALQVESGVVDVIWTGVVPEIARMRRNKALTVYEVKGAQADFIQVNAGRGALRDVRVRRALSFGINRQEISQVVYFGLAGAGASPILPSSSFHERNVEQYTYNPSRAKALLAEAGAQNLTIELEHLAETTTAQYSQVFQNQLARVGVNVVLKPREAATIIRDWSSGNYDLISFQLGPAPDPDSVLYRRFHSSAIVPKDVNANYSNPELDRLLDAARNESDAAKRKALYSQAQKIIVRDVPILILTFKSEYVVGSSGLQNLSYDSFSLFFDLGRKGGWKK
jgi:peptide/nickel transport system substrate-binding protein